jgi:hypothetical protein
LGLARGLTWAVKARTASITHNLTTKELAMSVSSKTIDTLLTYDPLAHAEKITG